jgi:hypothetical protein
MAPRAKTAKETKVTKPKTGRVTKPQRSATPTLPQKKAKPMKACKPIWAGKVFVITGDHGENKPHFMIEKWITNHGGRVEKTVTEETNYLICDVDDFKNKVDHGKLLAIMTPCQSRKLTIHLVKNAWKLGKARCKIVNFEYIEDCLHHKPIKALNDKTYQLQKIVAKTRRKKGQELLTKEGYIKDIEASKELADPSKFKMPYYVENLTGGLSLLGLAI